ncbi:MAG: putative DNA binding domain-containing protein [Candidatus Omnitrophica bacterium]|nr:putative DNA binding domain-containing protein [Candidatus Omnitrophota bacterium]
MNDFELESLLVDLESDRVERKESPSDVEKLRQAICAFSNDMPCHGGPGVLFVGVSDRGECANLKITDEMLRNLSAIRDDGNILPLPSLTIQKKTLRGCQMVVIEVMPSEFPPVRYKGRVWIRVGPRRAIATPEEEHRLAEKRKSKDLPYDLQPVGSASIEDLDLPLFQLTYLPSAVAPEVLAENQRTISEQVASLRFITAGEPILPTVVGLLAVGRSPSSFIPGAYIQFLRIDGTRWADPIADQKEVQGAPPDSLRRVDEILSANIHIATDIRSCLVERRYPDYPLDALQQIVRNAVMHREYALSNAPVRLTWFSDRVEILSPGGPYGQVTRDNFGLPGVTDYRNPNIAEVMRNLGFVQRFGFGIQLARRSLRENGNPEPVFEVQDNYIRVTVSKNR